MANFLHHNVATERFDNLFIELQIKKSLTPEGGGKEL